MQSSLWLVISSEVGKEHNVVSYASEGEYHCDLSPCLQPPIVQKYDVYTLKIHQNAPKSMLTSWKACP